jgi:chromosome segregation ATPase
MEMWQITREFHEARLEEYRREWEAVGREIDRKEREIETLRASIRESERHRAELSRLGRDTMDRLGGN